MEEQKMENDIEFIEIKETEFVKDMATQERRKDKLHLISKIILSVIALLLGAYVGYRLGAITGIICATFLSYTACVTSDLYFKS